MTFNIIQEIQDIFSMEITLGHHKKLKTNESN